MRSLWKHRQTGWDESQSAPQPLTNSVRKQLQAKLYLSIIDDVIENMRELFSDEGLEDRVLDDLRHVSYILHNFALFLFFFFKWHVMHISTWAVSYSKVRSSSEEVHTLARRQSAVSSAVQLWESKMMQSKAMEDFRKNNINSSNFVLQLPANYSQTDQEVTGNTFMPEMNCKTNISNYSLSNRYFLNSSP